MDFTQASKPQLLQIALYENCELELKYAVLYELRRRKIRVKENHKHDTWYSFYPLIMNDLDKLNEKIRQMTKELTAFGIDRHEAKRFITKKLMHRLPLMQKKYPKRTDRKRKVGKA